MRLFFERKGAKIKAVLTVLIFILAFQDCEKLDLKRVMDTSTDSILINGTSVQAFGTVLDLGDDEILQHGHCWATHNNPAITDNYSELGVISGAGSFYSILKSIKPGSIHYVRSYIFDGTNYNYGDEVSFEVTADDISFRIDSVRNLSTGTLLVNSSTTGIGSVTFANYGHCWSQNAEPTINDIKTSFGSYENDTTFGSIIHNFIFGRYYIRGYLLNEGEVLYSDTYIYESSICVETGTITIPLSKSIKADGTITSLGINQIINYGFCWSELTSQPNFNSNKTSNGSRLFPGIFSNTIEGLTSGEKYYIRAYATDGITVYYGEVKSTIPN